MSDMKTVESGSPGLYILGWPIPGLQSPQPFKEAFVIPVMCREGGILLAVPVDFLPQSVLESGATAEGEDLVGPSVTLEVPGVGEDEEGTERDAGLLLAVVLVDFARDVERGMSEFNPDAPSASTPMFLARCSGDSSIILFADGSGIGVDAGRVGLEGSLLLCNRGREAGTSTHKESHPKEVTCSRTLSCSGSQYPKAQEGYQCSVGRPSLSAVPVVAGRDGSTPEDARAAGQVREVGVDRSCRAQGPSLQTAFWISSRSSYPGGCAEVCRDDR